MQTTKVLLFGTCDTKLPELLYLRDQLLAHRNTQILLVDVSVGNETPNDQAIDIYSHDVLLLHPKQAGVKNETFCRLSRSQRINHMALCMKELVSQRHRSGEIHATISAGGSGNTSLAAEVMREALPLGFPKLIVSTIASGDTGPIVGEADITLMYSVVDVAGLNALLRSVLENAAGAVVGMAESYRRRLSTQSAHGDSTLEKKRVGITMFGVTTPAVNKIQKLLQESNRPVEVFVFHATGHGGKAMERLIREGGLDAVIDLTTTEICDYICGGSMSAGPTRLDAAASAGIPCIVSLGATDMVNFGPKSTVPERYQARQLYEHNPMITLMRTDKAECEQVGAFIVNKLKQATRPDVVQVWIPEGGVSAMASPNGPFQDQEADNALARIVETGLSDSGVEIVKKPYAINDEEFASGITAALIKLLGL
ncbi:hypothetical protein EJ05DRAFT_476224 [Pseudovirgaria hyperparasitica]|uniref:Uncharacterized protein n=1 Tax=Pseudovirgaria hyperparasitica TaxID=470096 RepID=A0A6A6WA02_9PEZI|nr:uncharacterized protein EJ05DRAFT_476224 [Pseudovirgaria hyperparasitica]KAF2757931.1 hypothetical protein EJ05DRAFT_476224 [Pseudovirgaria hyperparasitica]